MKKIGKKLNYFTKVLLVFSLLFSNLSGLSVVFAYGGEDNFTLDMNEDKIVVSYLSELDDEDEIKVDVLENYTYLDGSNETELTASYNVTGSEITDGYEMKSQMVPAVKFDGTYSVVVSLYDNTTEEDLGAMELTQDYTHEEGMYFTLLDGSDNILEANAEGKYEIDVNNSAIKLVGIMLSGGISPSDVFVYDGVEYTASELLEEGFYNEDDLAGHLYGEYTIPVEISLTKNGEDISYSKELNVVYGTYEMNTDKLNESANKLSLNDGYKFEGTAKDGKINVYLGENNTMFDLYQIVTDAIGESENITYVLSNNESENVLANVDDSTNLEEYLKEIKIDSATKLSLTDEDLTITYSVQILGDVNNDGTLNEDDLSDMINQVIGKDEETPLTSDIYGNDNKVTTFDVMYLSQILKNSNWNTEITEAEGIINGRLDISSEDIVSGDEFTIDYVVTIDEYKVNGIAGLITYDDSVLELKSVQPIDFAGDNYEGKYLYVGDTSLTSTTIEDEEGNITINPEEYVVLTLTFKALKAGTSTISIGNIEYFNDSVYYTGNEDLSTEVVVNESSDSSLSSLTVAGQSIELQEDVLEYSITVSNDVTVADVEAILSNDAASISSIVAPEELAIGENTITIVVAAENGDETVYTIKVTREDKKEEVPTQMSYQEPASDDTDTTISDNTPKNDDKKDTPEEENKEENKLSRIIIIILILLVIAGLIYLIFKDDKDEDKEETKKANKEINKLKKENSSFDNKSTKKVDNQKKVNKNNKKER